MGNVLVVTQDAAKRAWLQTKLSQAGFTVFPCRNDKVCGVFDAMPVAVVISDNVSTLRMLRSAHKSVPIILTLLPRDGRRDSSKGCRVIKRPYSMVELIENVEELCS